MKILVDEMPTFINECPFSEEKPNIAFKLVEWDDYYECRLDGKRCHLRDGACRWLKKESITNER